MNFPLKFLCSLLVATTAWGAATAAREEAVFLFEQRKVAVAVPAGFLYASVMDDTGVVHVRLEHPAAKVSFDVRFLPDRDGKFGGGRARRELMVEMFNEYVDSSTEKAMQFEDLNPRTGGGSYCVFTDSKLVGRTDLPPGEYLHLTAGVKTWPGVVAIFRFFSNDTTSPEYRAILTLLRESLQEIPVPLK
jgi:hypothetical protein